MRFKGSALWERLLQECASKGLRCGKGCFICYTISASSVQRLIIGHTVRHTLVTLCCTLVTLCCTLVTLCCTLVSLCCTHWSHCAAHTGQNVLHTLIRLFDGIEYFNLIPPHPITQNSRKSTQKKPCLISINQSTCVVYLHSCQDSLGACTLDSALEASNSADLDSK